MTATTWTFDFTRGGTLKFSTESLVAYVKRTAMERYNEGGWDVIVECWDDEQIAEVLGRTCTQEGALRKFRDVVAVYADRQADARNSAF